jgi:HSP20 family protein
MAQTLPIKKTGSLLDEMARIHSRVMQRAHDIFRTNGSLLGNDLANWLQAERELVWKPAIEVAEKDNEFRLEIAIAGVDPNLIDIEVTPDEVLVKAQTQHEHKKEKGDIYTCEFAPGNLFRNIRLPKKIDPEKVKAEYKNGLLTIKAPVAEEARVKKIAVAAA